MVTPELGDDAAWAFRAREVALYLAEPRTTKELKSRFVNRYSNEICWLESNSICWFEPLLKQWHLTGKAYPVTHFGPPFLPSDKKRRKKPKRYPPPVPKPRPGALPAGPTPAEAEPPAPLPRLPLIFRVICGQCGDHFAGSRPRNKNPLKVGNERHPRLHRVDGDPCPGSFMRGRIVVPVGDGTYKPWSGHDD